MHTKLLSSSKIDSVFSKCTSLLTKSNGPHQSLRATWAVLVQSIIARVYSWRFWPRALYLKLKMTVLLSFHLLHGVKCTQLTFMAFCLAYSFWLISLLAPGGELRLVDCPPFLLFASWSKVYSVILVEWMHVCLLLWLMVWKAGVCFWLLCCICSIVWGMCLMLGEFLLTGPGTHHWPS